MGVVTTSPKGQVVIPQQVREKLGIKPGSKVLVELVGDHVEVRPLPPDPIGEFCGVFKEGSSLAGALLRERKEDGERETAKGSGFLRPSGVSKGRKRV